jgi:hypothetical protein
MYEDVCSIENVQPLLNGWIVLSLQYTILFNIFHVLEKNNYTLLTICIFLS